MSFILDALRKSESERQQDARPSIARIPDAVQPRRLPVWALGTIGVLGLGVLVLSVAWWQSLGPQAVDAVAEAADERPEPARLAIRQRADERAPTPAAARPSAAAPALGTTTLRSAAAADAPQPPAASDPGAAANLSAASNRAGASGLPAVEAFVPMYAEMASQLGLPALRLELHGYADDAAARFVFINGAMYREGDTLTEGPRLIAISAQGAVLLAGGRQLLLGQE